jgi:hypothetical protein
MNSGPITMVVGKDKVYTLAAKSTFQQEDWKIWLSKFIILNTYHLQIEDIINHKGIVDIVYFLGFINPGCNKPASNIISNLSQVPFLGGRGGWNNIISKEPYRSKYNLSSEGFLVYFILSFLHLFTCAYIIWATSLPASRQNLLYPLVLQFYWGDNKKDIAFLLVWSKDSYTERFLALLPCICVLQPTLVHLYQTSSLLPGSLPIVASASLRLLYSLLYSEHINHIQVLGFLHFPYSSVHILPLVYDPCPIILLHLFQAYNLHMRENMWFLAFWA